MNSYESLLVRIRQVRRRWRSQVLVRGISLFLASTIGLLVLGIWGADLFGFRPYAVWSMRFLTGGTVLFVAWYFLFMPLRARISDVQIAQFIEEKYPHLEDRLITAVEYGEQRTSSGMIDLLIRDAFEKTSRVDFSVFLNRRRLAFFGTVGLGAFLLFFSLLTWGPLYFPYGFNSLYVPWTEASRVSSMMIMVVPGNIEIAKGSDQLIGAQLVGFDSPDVRLFLQSEESGPWHAANMEPDPRGSSFRYLLVDVQTSRRYYVESGGIRSQTSSIRVIDKSRVERIDLTYNFPAYTGMAPQVVEDEGDISALKGTRVDLRIHLNRPVESARLFFDNQTTLDLAVSGARDFSGSFVLQRSGSYVVQATESHGKNQTASSEYEMEAIEDAAPRVSITRPMRDVRATNVEEVFSEIKADDDIGMGKLELRYSVNGEQEKTARLFNGNPPQPSITASHTFFLEELGLQPGDLVSYYAKAWDSNNVTGPATSSSDIYFIQIRPFEQKYVQNQQQAMQGSQGEEGQQELSRQQKEIISATFKLIRDKDHMAVKEYEDSLKSLALVQSRLQAQTQGLVDRLQRRGAEQVDENFAKLSEYLKNAVVEMEKAAVDLGAQRPNDAMPEEQKSLQQLMRAESLFREIQVSFSNQSGGGNGSQANAEDLADLFELELNKLKNQYETVQRGEQQERDQKVDEALERLKELAKRQQQLNERNRMLAQRGGSSSSSGSGSGQSQQQLMEQAEQLQRQLQRLSRERSSTELNEASNRIQQAIEQMKQALKDSQSGNSAEAGAQGMRALQQLDEAARGITRNQNAGLKEGLEKALDESGKLVQEQSRIQEELDRLSKARPQDNSEEGIKQRGQDLVSRKSVLADRLNNLENQIRALSSQARKTQKETSSRLSDAADTIEENRLPERIMSGNTLIQNGFYESQKGREDFIRDALEDVNQQLQAARGSLGESKEGRMEEAADRARQLSEGLEAMQRRMRELQQGRVEPSGRRQGEGQQSRGQQQAQQQGRGQPQGQDSQNDQGQPGRGQGQGQFPEAGRRSQNSQTTPPLQGQNSQNLQGGYPNPDTTVRGLSQNAAGLPAGIGSYRDEETRQLNRDLEQRLTDAEDLRQFLDRNSTQRQNLERVIDSLRRARDYADFSNAEQIARLKAAIDYMRKVELDLARDLERLNQLEKYFLAEDNEAPSNYHKLVEEYYKSIAKTK